ncbi:hypothetical protein [Microbacterium sp. NIBRBAC000506063]|uniref:hypothetical protein n=1 Tax=Microbacterium sp. NIBRBAC000506063 TaxID=2734618 RepID=UPI001CB70F98|nr:hypothetical protein [Microbacterium sp. NIBRBAC000506063]
MASFSFGAGNLGKLLRIPLYLAGRIGVLLVPRGRVWVFGCGPASVMVRSRSGTSSAPTGTTRCG